MTEDQARTQLRRMLRTLPAGSVLHLLAEVVKDEADAEFVAGDFVAEDQTRIVLGTLYSLSVGVDAVRYRPSREA